MGDEPTPRHVPKLPAFDPKELQIDLYISLIETNFAAYGVTDDDQKKNLLLISIGMKTFATLSNLTAPDNPTTKSYTEIVNLLKGHFTSRPTYHRSLLLFQQRKKESNESLKDLYSDLKRLAKDCNFGNTFDTRLRDQLFMAIDSLPYFKFLVAEDLNLDTLTSARLLERIQTLEKAHMGEGVLPVEGGFADVKKIGHRPPTGSRNSSGSVGASGIVCKHCGFPHNSSACRFKHLNCRRCGVQGHLEKMCKAPPRYEKSAKSSFNKNSSKFSNKSKHVRQVEEADSASMNDYSDFQDDNMLMNIEMIDSVDVKSVKPIVYNFMINDLKLPLEIDSGACVSLINRKDCEVLNMKISDSARKLSAYGGCNIHVLGEVKTSVCFNGRSVSHIFYVTDASCNNLCGRDLMEKLGIHLIGVDESSKVMAVHSGDVSDLINQYHIDESKPISGCNAKIYMKDNVQPKFIKARQVPEAHKVLVNEAIDELIKKDIIEPVKFSEWASPIVPVLKKNGKMRICTDFKDLNSKMNVEKYPLPRLEEMLSVVSDNKLFSKLDMSNAYLQMAVDPEDQKFLVISTEKGLFKFKRLAYGLASAPGIFQRFVEQLLGDIEGVAVFLDDILICAKSEYEQFEKISMVLKILKNANIQLNKAKCDLNKTSIDFLGYVLSDKGISPSPNKVHAIKNAPVPKNVVELQAFIGLVTYYSRFIYKFSEIMHPLYELTKKNVKFQWSRQCQISYDLIKKSICTSDVLVCFTGKSKIILEVDASPVGVGAVLLQVENGVEKPIAFSSKKLTSAQANYSQTDREALAIVVGVTKFKYYLLGRQFEIRTDHKPLLGLFGRHKRIPTDANARLIRWSILLSMYAYDLVYKAGKTMVVSDALSRLPISEEIFSNVPEEYVHMIDSLENFNYSLDNIQQLTKDDKVLSKLLCFLKYGWPDNDMICSEFTHVKNDLSIHDDIVLFRNRLIVPSKIRPNILNLLHAGHNGMVAMKAEARQNLWWPNISIDIEERVKNCNQCTVANKQINEPKMYWPETGKTWERLHIDYCGPVDNLFYLIIIDSHSKFMDVHACRKTDSSTTIECLRKTFANFGIPKFIVSDNAQYFVSSAMKSFYSQNNITLKNPAPFHPASNGLCERAVRTFKEGMKKFSNGSINTRISRFLYNYRRTVHSVTKVSPDEVMFNRKFRSPLNIELNASKTKEQDGRYWSNMYSVGQSVFAKNFGKGKSWLPGVVTEVRGLRNYVVKVFGESGDVVWRRHSDQLKLRYNDSEPSTDVFESGENVDSNPNIVMPKLMPNLVSKQPPVLKTPPSRVSEEYSSNSVPENNAFDNNSDANITFKDLIDRENFALENSSVKPSTLHNSPQVTRSGRVSKAPVRYGI